MRKVVALGLAVLATAAFTAPALAEGNCAWGSKVSADSGTKAPVSTTTADAGSQTKTRN